MPGRFWHIAAYLQGCLVFVCYVELFWCYVFFVCTASPVSTATECRNKNVIESRLRYLSHSAVTKSFIVCSFPIPKVIITLDQNLARYREISNASKWRSEWLKSIPRYVAQVQNRRIKIKTLRHWTFYEETSPVTREFPERRPVTRKIYAPLWWYENSMIWLR